MKLIHTDGKDNNFIELCGELDDYLNDIVGGEKQQSQYNQHNSLRDIEDVVLVIEDEQVVGCGSFKAYEIGVAEVKRVFIKETHRGRGIAKQVMKEIEQEALRKGYRELILETSVLLVEAKKLYQSIGFSIIPNYGPYKGISESICMRKKLIE